MESHFIYVTLLHSINVKAMLIILHYGLMTEDDMNTINKKKRISIFSAATIFFMLPVLLLKLMLTFRYGITFHFRMCLCVSLSIIWHIT